MCNYRLSSFGVKFAYASLDAGCVLSSLLSYFVNRDFSEWFEKYEHFKVPDVTLDISSVSEFDSESGNFIFDFGLKKAGKMSYCGEVV